MAQNCAGKDKDNKNKKGTQTREVRNSYHMPGGEFLLKKIIKKLGRGIILINNGEISLISIFRLRKSKKSPSGKGEGTRKESSPLGCKKPRAPKTKQNL